MINRTSSVASVAIMSMLTSISIGVSSGAASGADECRESPGIATLPGGHWRYRMEKGTGRKCWYLASASDAASGADEKPAAEPKPAPVALKPRSAEMQPSVADARAELTTSERAQLNATVWPLLQSPQNDTNGSQARAKSQAQNTAIAERWPMPNSVLSSDRDFSDSIRLAANDEVQVTTPVPSPPTAQAAAQEDNALSPIRILLVAVIGALALIAVLMRFILSYMAKRRKRNVPRRPIWDDLAIDAEQMPPYMPRSAPTQPAQYTGAKNPRYAYRDDQEAREEIEHLLRRTTSSTENYVASCFCNSRTNADKPV